MRHHATPLLVLLAVASLQAAALDPGPELMSRNVSNFTPGNQDSYEGAVTPNGRWVVFDTEATNLGLPSSAGDYQVVLHDRKTLATSVVSRATDLVSAGNGDSIYPMIPANGRIVVYTSEADDLVAGDANGEDDLFRYDTRTGETVLLSVNEAGEQADAACEAVGNALSQNGRFLVFSSTAGNLAAGIDNGFEQVYVLDLKSGAITHVSADPAGGPSDSFSNDASISPNGRFVAFSSLATDIDPAASSGMRNVFLRDLKRGTTTWISMDAGGGNGDGHSNNPVVSNDGRTVVFRSNSSDLAAGDGNGKFDLFVRDVKAGTTQRITVNSSGQEGNGHANELALSSNGKTLVFRSSATNVIAGIVSASGGIYALDRRQGTIRQLDLALGALPDAGGYVGPAALDPTGKWLLFSSQADNLAGQALGGVYQTYVIRVR